MYVCMYVFMYICMCMYVCIVCVCMYVYVCMYGKVKWSRYRPGVAQRVGRSIALLFHDRGTRRGCVVSSTPHPHFTPGKDPVPILQEAEYLVPTGIRSRTVQPVASHYTDWATRPPCVCISQQCKTRRLFLGSAQKNKRLIILTDLCTAVLSKASCHWLRTLCTKTHVIDCMLWTYCGRWKRVI
jgi:hypothetical protein